MRVHKQKVIQPIEVVEIQVPQRVVEIQQSEKWVQEEEKHKNRVPEWEHPQERVQRLVPGLDLKRFFL